MALILADRVRETSTTTGTGALSLAGAVVGYQTFSSAIGNANTCYYAISNPGVAEWEVGIGTYATSGNTLTRTTIIKSSNANAAVNFSAGTKDVFVTYPATKSVYLDASGNASALGTPASGTVTNLTGTASININGTVGATTANTGAFTTLSSTLDATIYGVTVGRGGGAVSTNTAVGYQAGYSNTTGTSNAFLGYTAGYSNTGGANTALGAVALFANSSGNWNTAVGEGALYANTTASLNTAVGYRSLLANTTGANNVAVGAQALNSNTTASNNTAVGYQAGYTNTTGAQNTDIGMKAGYLGTVRTYTTSMGYFAGYSSNGTSNTYIGYASGPNNGTASVESYNTGIGAQALNGTTTGSNNTAVGYQALYANTTGINNVALGYQAGNAIISNGYSTFVGTYAGLSTTGANSTFVGYGAGNLITTGAKNTIIGAYNGNQSGLDIRTASNYIVLSDGDGNPRGYFDSSGDLLVGNGSTVAERNLYVKSDSANRPYLRLWSGTAKFEMSIGSTAVINSVNAIPIVFYTNNTESMRIASGGIVTMSAYGVGTATFSGTGVISSVSDETWKVKDGAPVDTDAMLNKLEPGYWYYNDEKKETFGKDRQLGFYAQNVNAAIGPEAAPEPETVTTKNDDGTETSVTKPWGYYDRSVLAVTVMSLQKALATIESLTARITALENK